MPPFIPELTYNEERPQFVGRDVEGMKELNATLAQKYDINKQAKIQAEDLLHSFKTLDTDAPYLTDAITGFNDELQYIVDNNQFERAGQAVEKAVTNIKRNKALEQSIGNYASYTQYAQDLKENPNGWTDEEVSNVIGFSLDNYSGVKVDKNGQAVGTFYGYNPGEKINVLSEFDEALKGFASDKGFEITEIRDLLQDRTQKAFSTISTESVDREEIVAYLKQYYSNDPRINKFYETKTILDSRKSGGVLSNEVINNIRKLDLFSVYGSKYKAFLGDNGVTADNQEIDALEFVQWMLKQDTGLDYNIEGLMSIANTDSEAGNIAKMKLAEVNNMLSKNLDFEAAAIKNGFSKTDIKHTRFEDKLLTYRLKKLEDANSFIYTMAGASTNYGQEYIGRNGTKRLSDDVNNLKSKLELADEGIEKVIKDAIVNKDYVVDPATGTGEWIDENSAYKVDHDTKLAERNIINSELKAKQATEEASIEYGLSKINPNIENKVTDLNKYYKNQILELKRKLALDQNAPGDIFDANDLGVEELGFYEKKKAEGRLKYYEDELKILETDGYNGYVKRYNKLRHYNYTFDDKAKELANEVNRIDNDNKKYRQEYLDNYSIKTFNPTILQIDPELNKNISDVMTIVEGHYSRNNGAYVVRDENGNIVSDINKRPASISISGMSTGRFIDGILYYEAVATVQNDNDKLVDDRRKDGTLKKYYVSAQNASLNQQVGTMLASNTNIEAAAFGYQLAQPTGYEFVTKNLTVANQHIPIVSREGKELGTAKLYSSETKGVPDFKTALIEYKIPQSILNTLKEKYPTEKWKDTYTFDSRAKFERTLNDISAIINTK